MISSREQVLLASELQPLSDHMVRAVEQRPDVLQLTHFAPFMLLG
jgi:hypothetical protein